MVVQLLQEYLASPVLKPGSQTPDPQFQQLFKTWVRTMYAGPPAIHAWVQSLWEQSVQRQPSDPLWPSEADVHALCAGVCRTFDARDWPMAFAHLLLALTPVYNDNGTLWDQEPPWQANNDPIRLPPINVGRFYQCIQTYVAGQPQFAMTRAMLQKGPPAKSVILLGTGPHTHGAMHQARAVCIPYHTPASAGLLLQPMDFTPDPECLESMQTAARECVDQLKKEVQWFEGIRTVLGSSFDVEVSTALADYRWLYTALGRVFGRATTVPTPASQQSKSYGERLVKQWRFLNLGLIWLGLFFYGSVVFEGRGWVSSFNPCLLLLPYPRLGWGLGVACACLTGGLVGALCWSEVRGLLSRQQPRSHTATRGHYVLVFVEDLDETPYEEQLAGNSFGLAFFCAFVGALAPRMPRPPAWARYVMALMDKGHLVACAGLTTSTEDQLQPVNVTAKLAAITADTAATTGVFALRNCGEMLAQWSVKPTRWKAKWVQARERETARGMRVLCFNTVAQMIAYGLTPYQQSRISARVALGALCLLGFFTLWTPAPTVSVQVLSKGHPKPHETTPTIPVISDMQPDEQVTIQLTIMPQWWPVALKVESEAKTLLEGRGSHCLIHKRVWPQTPATVAFHMPQGTSQVLVGITVQDVLHRRDQRMLAFELSQRATP